MGHRLGNRNTMLRLPDPHPSQNKLKKNTVELVVLLLLLLLLLQSALQPLWVMACSTIVEYSQQEGF